MKNSRMTKPRLLNPCEAAKYLNVSEKTLWNNTAPRGKSIPVVRLGERKVLYSPVALDAWIAAQSNAQNGQGA